MAQTGTLAALKELFSARRTVTVDTILTPADIGRTILVDTSAGAVTITLPAITGDGSAGINGIGSNGQICIVLAEASNGLTIASPGATPDTYNGGQAFPPAAFTTLNSFAIFVSDGAATAPGDWLALLHVA